MARAAFKCSCWPDALCLQYIVCSTGRKAEVLKLMAQVLDFDADTQQRVRARRLPSTGIPLALLTRVQVGLSGKGWMSWLSGSQPQAGDDSQVRQSMRAVCDGVGEGGAGCVEQNVGDVYVTCYRCVTVCDRTLGTCG